MLEFCYKTILLIFTIFSTTRSTSTKGEWEQLYCYGFTSAEKESSLVHYVYIFPKIWEMFWLTKYRKPDRHTGNIKHIN